MATRKTLAAVSLAAVAVVGVAGAAAANAANGGASPTSSTSASTDGGKQNGKPDHQRGQHTAVTGAEATKVGDAVKAKYPGVTIDKVDKDTDGSYDVLATKSGSKVMYEVSKDLKTITERTGGPGHGGRDGKGGNQRGQHTPVTGTEATKVGDAVKAKYPGVTIDKVDKDTDGSYDVLATKSGSKVMYEVSKDLKTITERTGGPGHSDRGPRGGGSGGTTAPSPSASGSAA